jgi:hypothetical protein
MSDLVDQLLARPGRYVGSQTRPNETDAAPPDVACIDVTALPGASGVMLAYEVLSVRGEAPHREHALVARSSNGIVLVTSHTHADITTVIPEAEPGWFPAAEGTAPFPMAIRLEVPEPGRLVYSWSYGWGDQPVELRDQADVRIID